MDTSRRLHVSEGLMIYGTGVIGDYMLVTKNGEHYEIPGGLMHKIASIPETKDIESALEAIDSTIVPSLKAQGISVDYVGRACSQVKISELRRSIEDLKKSTDL